ncbi:universal stress protein [Halovivax limisalsi]|uniref:universal stress protein n=1 Tax=Halovivax limisalsi TaxID=1453760 RepID=UPI001FFC9529|nr:universal stress protein [Halovivax limisalsi]
MTPPAPIDSILIPTDGSDGSLVGANRGLELAATVGATVHVLAVVDQNWIDGPADGDGDADDSAAANGSGPIAAAEDAVASVERLAEEYGPGLAVRTTVERGSPADEITAYADANDVDAIAMGTKGLSGLDRVVLGSVTETVLRTASVPVVAVPPGARDASLTADGVEELLLPTDGSEGAEIAAEWAIDLAAAVDATVRALYSVESTRMAAASDPEGALAHLEREGEDALEAVRERARDRRCTVEGTVAHGPAVDEILASVDEHDVDLVAMGTRGRSSIGQHLLGSTTENVVRDAAVPIACVPLPDDE